MSDDSDRRDGPCHLCFSDCKVYGEVVPGYWLVRTGEPDRRGWRWALAVNLHEVAYSWTPDPLASPYDAHTREEVDSWADDDPRHAEEDRHIESVDTIEPAFRDEPVAGWCLVQSCIEAGWDWDHSGMVLIWLVDRMARLIARVEANRR